MVDDRALEEIASRLERLATLGIRRAGITFALGDLGGYSFGLDFEGTATERSAELAEQLIDLAHQVVELTGVQTHLGTAGQVVVEVAEGTVAISFDEWEKGVVETTYVVDEEGGLERVHPNASTGGERWQLTWSALETHDAEAARQAFIDTIEDDAERAEREEALARIDELWEGIAASLPDMRTGSEAEERARKLALLEAVESVVGELKAAGAREATVACRGLKKKKMKKKKKKKKKKSKLQWSIETIQVDDRAQSPDSQLGRALSGLANAVLLVWDQGPMARSEGVTIRVADGDVQITYREEHGEVITTAQWHELRVRTPPARDPRSPDGP